MPKVSCTTDAGVSSCEIKKVEYGDNKSEATVTADVVSWAKFIDEKDEGFVINAPKEKTQYVFAMKKEGTWKVYNIQSMNKVELDTEESNGQTETMPNDNIEAYTTFAEAKSAVSEINMD